MRAGTENLRDFPLYELARSGLFELLANGHFPSSFQQSGHVTVCRVKGDAAHRNRAAFCKRDIEELCAHLGIFKEHFVEIPKPEQQQRILGQFAFDPAILRHHGRQLAIVRHRSQNLIHRSGQAKKNYERVGTRVSTFKLPRRTEPTSKLVRNAFARLRCVDSTDLATRSRCSNS